MQQILLVFIKWSSLQKVWVNLYENSFMRLTPSIEVTDSYRPAILIRNINHHGHKALQEWHSQNLLKRNTYCKGRFSTIYWHYIFIFLQNNYLSHRDRTRASTLCFPPSFEHAKNLLIMGPKNIKNSSKSVISSYLTLNNIVRILLLL